MRPETRCEAVKPPMGLRERLAAIMGTAESSVRLVMGIKSKLGMNAADCDDGGDCSTVAEQVDYLSRRVIVLEDLIRDITEFLG